MKGKNIQEALKLYKIQSSTLCVICILTFMLVGCNTHKSLTTDGVFLECYNRELDTITNYFSQEPIETILPGPSDIPAYVYEGVQTQWDTPADVQILLQDGLAAQISIRYTYKLENAEAAYLHWAELLVWAEKLYGSEVGGRSSALELEGFEKFEAALAANKSSSYHYTAEIAEDGYNAKTNLTISYGPEIPLAPYMENVVLQLIYYPNRGIPD